MASTRGRLSLLTIGTIFLVVLGTMQIGLQYSRGDLDREPLTDLERGLRADLWAAVDAERAERGLEPANRETSAQATAQDTARQLATTDYFEAPTAAGRRPTANQSLPNDVGLCQQRPVKLTVTHAGWTTSGGGTVSPAVRRDVAAQLFELLDAGEVDLFDRPSDHQHGLGVVVDGDVVYAVYRTCNLGY